MKLYNILLLFFISLIFLGCHQKEESKIKQINTPIKIGLYNGEASLIPIVAQENGYFKEFGLNNITINYYKTGKDAFATMLKKEVDYSNCTEFVNTKNSFKNSEFYVLASTAKGDINGVLAKKSSGINTPKDLKNKQVGTTIGTATEFFTGVFLKQHNMEMSDINLVSVKANERMKAMANPNLDALFAWDPYIYRLKEKYGNKLAYFPMPVGFSFFFTFNVDKLFHQKNPEISKKLLKAFIKAEEWIDANPKEVEKIIMTKFKYDIKYTKYSLQKHSFQVTFPLTLKTTMEAQKNWLIENNLVDKDKKISIDNILRYKILKDLGNERVSYVR
jgi:NitT/TauT family transport system substrate-binding protein